MSRERLAGDRRRPLTDSSSHRSKAPYRDLDSQGDPNRREGPLRPVSHLPAPHRQD